MLSKFQDTVKQSIEKFTGCRIYRNSIPHGADMFFDIGRRYGRDKIRIAFDVGANIGQSATKYAEEFPIADIYSFEPVKSTFDQLVANTRHIGRVHPFNLGMGPKVGEASIHLNELSVMNSIAFNRAGDDRTETIQLETIPSFASNQGVDQVDFLKIDTEGFDLQVLAGAAPMLQKQKIHLILCECEPFTRTRGFATIAELGEFFSGFGYSLSGVYEQQPEWDGKNRLLFCNALFVCEKLLEPNAPWQ